MCRCYYFVFLLAVSSFCYATTKNINVQLQKVVNDIRDEYHISALSLSVGLPMQSKTKNYVSGNLSIQDKAAIKSDNLFQVGSITKNFTSVLMLQLVESGKVKLDDQIDKYLPEYPKWKSITIRQLLNHTSGCYDYIDSPNWWENISTHREKVWQPAELLAIAYSHVPYFVPGHGWHYSNTNYVLAGLIIEKVNRQSFHLQMQNLLEQAKLTNSYYLPFVYPQNILAKMVHGYYQTYDETTVNGSWGHGAAALVSTPSQVVIWVKELFAGKIIPKQELQLMQDAVAINNGQPTQNTQIPAYGLGMFRMNTPKGPIWFTPGLTSGYRSLWVYLPCAGITFAYSASNSLIGEEGKGFHKQMLQEVILTLMASQVVRQQIRKYRQQSTTLPAYCKTTTPSQEWSFININRPQLSH